MTLKVPINSAGNLMHHVRFGQEFIWKEMGPFEATMEYAGYQRGRSAMTFFWRDEDGKVFPMFLSDFDKMIGGAVFAFGKVWGIWTPVRKSGYFGITYELPETE